MNTVRLSLTEFNALNEELEHYRAAVDVILNTVNEQVNDEALWFTAQYASEAYVQQNLRELHLAIEESLADGGEG